MTIKGIESSLSLHLDDKMHGLYCSWPLCWSSTLTLWHMSSIQRWSCCNSLRMSSTIDWAQVLQQIPSTYAEASGLSWSDGKQPDGATIMPWKQLKPGLGCHIQVISREVLTMRKQGCRFLSQGEEDLQVLRASQDATCGPSSNWGYQCVWYSGWTNYVSHRGFTHWMPHT